MNSRTTLILALCLVVVGLYMVFVAKPWQAAEKPPETPRPQDVWTDKPKTDDIERVEIVSPRWKRVFAKQDDKWLIEEPIRGTASKWMVDEVVREIIDAKCAAKYEKGAKGRPSDATTELNAPPFTVALTAKDKKTYALKVGRRTPTGGDTYVQKIGSDDILVVDKNLHTSLDKRLSEIRDKRVVDFKAEEAVRVKVEGVENFELVKSGNDWMLESPVRARADKNKADSMVRTISNLYAMDFQHDKPVSLQPYGLEQPRLTVTVTVEHKVEKKPDPASTQPAETQPTIEKKTYVVQYGGPTDAKAESYFAKIGGEDPVFTVSKLNYTEAAPKLIDLRDKQIAKVDPARCKKIEVVLPSQSFVLEKKGANWQLPDGTVAEFALVDDLLKAVRDMKAVQFESKDSLLGVDLEKARARLTITQEGEPAPITVAVLGRTASQKNAYVRTGTDDSVAVVTEESIAALLAEPISYHKREMLTFVRDHAERIEITRADQTAVLTKAGAKWSLVSPIAADADGDAVRDALTDLSSLRAKKAVAKGDFAKYGLDKPDVTVTVTVQPPAPKPPSTSPATAPAVASKPGMPTIDELRKNWEKNNPGKPLPADLAAAAAETAPADSQPAASKPAATQPAASQPAPPPKTYRLKFARKGNEAYAMVEGTDLVYQVDTKIYDHVAAEMRDRTLAKFDVAQATSVSLIRPGEEMEFAQANNKWSYRQDNTVALDDQKVKDLINAVRDARTHRYVRYKAAPADLPSYKLDAPALKVVVTTGGDKKVALLVSAEGPAGDADKSKYATVEGSDTVFLLKGEQIDKLQKKLSDFVKSDKPETPPPTPGGSPSFGSPMDE